MRYLDLYFSLRKGRGRHIIGVSVSKSLSAGAPYVFDSPTLLDFALPLPLDAIAIIAILVS